jgi:hypothetical protein
MDEEKVEWDPVDCDPKDWGEDPTEDCQDCSAADEGPDAPKRFGNNRKHVPKWVSKAKRKAAKISKRKNRGKK